MARRANKPASEQRSEAVSQKDLNAAGHAVFEGDPKFQAFYDEKLAKHLEGVRDTEAMRQHFISQGQPVPALDSADEAAVARFEWSKPDLTHYMSGSQAASVMEEVCASVVEELIDAEDNRRIARGEEALSEGAAEVFARTAVINSGDRGILTQVEGNNPESFFFSDIQGQPVQPGREADTDQARMTVLFRHSVPVNRVPGEVMESINAKREAGGVSPIPLTPLESSSRSWGAERYALVDFHTRAVVPVSVVAVQATERVVNGVPQGTPVLNTVDRGPLTRSLLTDKAVLGAANQPFRTADGTVVKNQQGQPRLPVLRSRTALRALGIEDPSLAPTLSTVLAKDSSYSVEVRRQAHREASGLLAAQVGMLSPGSSVKICPAKMVDAMQRARGQITANQRRTQQQGRPVTVTVVGRMSVGTDGQPQLRSDGPSGVSSLRTNRMVDIGFPRQAYGTPSCSPKQSQALLSQAQREIDKNRSKGVAGLE